MCWCSSSGACYYPRMSDEIEQNAPDSGVDFANADRKRELRGMFFALVGASCWGFSACCVSFLTDRNGVDILWLADTRLLLAGTLFLIIALVRDRKRLLALFSDRKLVFHLVLYALLAVVLMQLTYMPAIKYTNPGTALFLLELSIPMVLVFDCVRGRRLPSLVEAIALVLALAGVLAIATQGNLGSLGISPIGLMFGLLAAISNASYIILGGRLVDSCGSLITNGVGMLLGALILLPFGRPWEVPQEMDASGWMAFAGIVLIGTMLAYVLYLRGVSDAGRVRASLIGVFEPVSGVIISALWLGTVFSGWDFLGGVAIVAMMILVALEKR